jgi:hypothetical protein
MNRVRSDAEALPNCTDPVAVLLPSGFHIDHRFWHSRTSMFGNSALLAAAVDSYALSGTTLTRVGSGRAMD